MRKKILIIFVIIVLALIILNSLDLKKLILKRMYSTQYEEYVYRYSNENNIDPLLIFAIIKAESNFNKDSVSSSNAKGLMQLMDSTAKDVAKKTKISEEINLFDAETNIKLGTNYIAMLLNYYKNNLYLSLAAYNAGIGNVNKWIEKEIIKADGSDIENIPFKETENYVRKVQRNYRIYMDIL